MYVGICVLGRGKMAPFLQWAARTALHRLALINSARTMSSIYTLMLDLNAFY